MLIRIITFLGVLTVAWMAQDQPPVFRTGVDLVQLDVAVLDEHRVPVRDLTAADFTVLDDGHPRSLKAFSVVDLSSARSIEAEWIQRVPSDIATNAAGTQDGRLVVILMDRSINVGQGNVTARKIATAAIEALAPGDLGAVVSTSGGVPQNLTADRSRLLRAITQRDWSTDGLDPYRNPPFTLESALKDGRCLCGLCVLEMITRVSDAVRDTPRRRKLLLFIGTGAVLQVGAQAASGDVGCDKRVRDAREKMLDSLAVSNLTIHAIDTKGLVSVGPQTNVMIHGAPGGGDRAGPADRLRRQQQDTTDLFDLHQSLQTLAAWTGGRAVMDTNAPEAKVPEIFRESERYYVLGFERDPTTAAADARRSIEVRVNRKGAHVYAQRRYAPPQQAPLAGQPSPDTGAAVTAALAGLLPSAGARLSVAAAPFASPDGNTASLSIVVDVGAFAQANASVPLQVHVAGIDARGQQVSAAHQTSTIAPSNQRSEAPPVVNVPTHLELPAGDYEIRLAVADASRGRVASVFQQVSVPSFAQARISLSGIEMGVDRLATATASQSVVSPVTQRTFTRADHARAAFEVYQGTQRTDALVPVSVRLSVADAQGKTVHEETSLWRPTPSSAAVRGFSSAFRSTGSRPGSMR